ncbi:MULTISPECIES: TorF family putative porin [Acinetobacter]|uniref:TorF family putative porin n=1 Tax=Acinetobacter TaxID=469 RepID=UPI0020C89F94|nr:TorF family putative porin [Acinetobacter sp. Z1]UTO19323.1 TorF family putative porin [Acinetobacter sp. Z1]
MMKFACKAIALSIFAVTSTFAMAEETTPLSQYGLSFSGSAALTSDYRFRGMTQTENDAAIQGGFALTHSSGLYAGVWGSNVEFGDINPKAHLELDPYIGYATALPFAGKPTLDVGLWYYGYPSSSDSNWLELYAKLGFKDLVTSGDSLLAAVNYTNDWGGTDENGWYLNATYNIPFADTGFGGVASVGYTKVDDTDFNSDATDGLDDNYVDWKVGVTYSVKSVSGLTAELAAIGTNIDANVQPLKRGVETGAVFTLTKTF